MRMGEASKDQRRVVAYGHRERVNPERYLFRAFVAASVEDAPTSLQHGLLSFATNGGVCAAGLRGSDSCETLPR